MRQKRRTIPTFFLKNAEGEVSMKEENIPEAEPVKIQSLSYSEVLKKNKLVAFFVAVTLLFSMIGVLWVAMNYEDLFHPQVSFEDMRDSKSERNNQFPTTFIVSDASPFYPLIATPVAVFYDKGGSSHASPLLVVNQHEPSRAVERFFEVSAGKFSKVTTIGDVGSLSDFSVNVKHNFNGSLEKISKDVALSFWRKADGALIVEPTKRGYQLAVASVPLASYLNIPVIVTDDVDDVKDTLENLGVDYTIIAGEKKDLAYKKIYHIQSEKDVRSLTLQLIEKRLNREVNYIAIANPMDAFEAEVVDSVYYHFEGVIEHSETGSSANPGASGSNAPTFYFEIPEDYTWAKVTVDTKMELENYENPIYNSNVAGDRIYTYIGTDRDKDGVILNDEDSPEDELDFFTTSLAHGYYYNKTEQKWYGRSLTYRPMFKDTGEHSVQVLASIPSEQIGLGDGKAKFTIDIVVEKLTEPHVILMPRLSTLAPYLASYRGGVVLSNPEYRVHSPEYVDTLDCGEPDTSEELMKEANYRATFVKRELNKLLGEIAHLSADDEEDWVALADYFYGEDGKKLAENPMCLGIIADTNMVPWYYYTIPPSGFEPYEGFGLPSDNYYIDIDSATPYSDPSRPPFSVKGDDPRMELAVGRVTGWDSQDVSALLARTFFYYHIIENFPGQIGSDWKHSAMTSFGSEPPVETTASAMIKLDLMWSDAGFKVDTTRFNELARREFSPETVGETGLETYQLYERSNYIFVCAHGFYYWYVPSAQESLVAQTEPIKGTGAGGAFDVAHVKDMNFGPSIIYASSCVTGKIDGIPGRDALSQAFLHAGFNAYVGASRLSYGALVPVPDEHSDEHLGNYLACLMYAYLTGGVFYDKEKGQIYMPYEDCTMGSALALAKNTYIENKDPADSVNLITYAEFNLMGDPAFNPYEPNH